MDGVLYGMNGFIKYIITIFFPSLSLLIIIIHYSFSFFLFNIIIPLLPPCTYYYIISLLLSLLIILFSICCKSFLPHIYYICRDLIVLLHFVLKHFIHISPLTIHQHHSASIKIHRNIHHNQILILQNQYSKHYHH